MRRGSHPYKSKTYIIDSNLNIHIATTSIQAKYITHDSLESNRLYARSIKDLSELESKDNNDSISSNETNTK